MTQRTNAEPQCGVRWDIVARRREPSLCYLLRDTWSDTHTQRTVTRSLWRHCYVLMQHTHTHIGQLSLSSSPGRLMSSKLHQLVLYCSFSRGVPPGELRVKACVVLLAGKTVWSTPEHLRGEVLTTMRYTNPPPLSLPLHTQATLPRDLMFMFAGSPRLSPQWAVFSGWSTGSSFDLIGPSSWVLQAPLYLRTVLCRCSLKIILTSLYLVEGLASWDWPFTWWTDQLLSFSAWHCLLGHLTRKSHPQYDL